MRRRPSNMRIAMKNRIATRVCLFCEESGNLSVAAHEKKSITGQLSREIFRFHQKCLDEAVEDENPTAVAIVEAIKQTHELNEKRRKFFEKKGVSATQWYNEHKKDK